MTNEEDFQAALDKDPTDDQTRLVFADWLDERGDPRGPGYRALGMLRRQPKRVKWAKENSRAPDETFEWHNHKTSAERPSGLRNPWFVCAAEYERKRTASKSLGGAALGGDTLAFETRRLADDAAAMGWLGVPDTMKAAWLVRGPCPCPECTSYRAAPVQLEQGGNKNDDSGN